jgi:hypothetical protein
MLMGSELPAVSAILGRLPSPEIHLGAYGVVFGLSLIVEAPVIMLLAASTTLSKDWASYVRLRRYAMWMSAVATAIHVLIAFTPLYDLVMIHVIGLPDVLMEPARIGLRIMTPWTWAIAFRRFNQGVLIRFDHTRAVGLGTVVRLIAVATVLGTGYSIGTVPGIAVGTSAVIAGVLSEALFIGLRVRPVLRDELRAAPPASPPIGLRAFVDFYVPLALTSFIMLILQPMGSAALSRGPMPIESLAIWPVMGGLVFIFRSFGMAHNEVVVALLEKPGASRVLRRFTVILMLGATLPIVVIAATPLAGIIFERVFSLEPHLAELARNSLPLALLLPAVQPWISWFQGRLTFQRRTRSITESVALFVLLTTGLLWAGVQWGQVAGVYVGWVAFSAGTFLRFVWLWFRSRQTSEAPMPEVAPA